MNLLIIALAPAIALIVYVYYRDKHNREPLGLVLRVFIFGMLSTIPAALLEQYFNVEDKNNLIVTAYSTFLIIAGAEEGSKYLFLRWGSQLWRIYFMFFHQATHCKLPYLEC